MGLIIYCISIFIIVIAGIVNLITDGTISAWLVIGCAAFVFFQKVMSHEHKELPEEEDCQEMQQQNNWLQYFYYLFLMLVMLSSLKTLFWKQEIGTEQNIIEIMIKVGFSCIILFIVARLSRNSKKLKRIFALW